MGQTEEGADSRRQNEGGEKDSEGGISFSPHPAMAWKTMAFLRRCADKAALKKTNGHD